MKSIWVCTACLLMACGAPPVHSPTAFSDPSTITRLQGYRTSFVQDPVFGGAAFVLEAGPPSAPTVVLVHGLGQAASRDWYPILPALAKQHHVIAIDLPGFGRSSHGTELYSPEKYAQFLHEVVRSIEPRPFCLVGHSMGGAVAMLYAARHPESVDRLVLIDVAGVLHREAVARMVADAGIGLLFEPLQGPAITITGALIGRPPSPSSLLENALTRKTLLGDSEKIAALALILENFGPAMAAVRAPTLLIWGEGDRIAPLRTGVILRRRIPSARLEVLRGSAHVPMQTDPRAVERLVSSWIDSPSMETRVPAWSSPPLPETVLRVGRCEGQHEVLFEGDYSEIDISSCTKVMLRDVRAGAVRISDSVVTMQGGSVGGGSFALMSTQSRVTLTGCDLEGDVALMVDGGELDVAGADLSANQAVVVVKGASRIVFSVTRVHGPGKEGYLHDAMELRGGDRI